MLKRLIAQVMLILTYEALVVLGLVAAVRWLTMMEAAPAVRALAFLAGMGLFMPPLFFATLSPYRAPDWLKEVQLQGSRAAAEVLENEHTGDYWRPQDMSRYVRIRVRVEPEEGKPFEARLTCRLDEAQALRPGTRLRLRYDPQHPERAALEAQPMP